MLPHVMGRSVLLFSLLGLGIVAACGSSREPFEATNPNDPADGGGNGGFGPGTDAGLKPPCVGLECKQVACPSGTTTITGTVWDPAGKNPVYNAVVYVPNAPLAEIKHGAVCDSCGGAPISGNPVATTLTDPKGNFTLKNVPVVDDVPLVIQVGKWRRQITFPGKIKQCEENKLEVKELSRLPRNKTEGDLPLIALTSGCDPIHTLVEKIGVDKSEFTNSTGNGSVHIFKGNGSTTANTSGAVSAYTFWGDLNQMMKYDIIINECECTPYDRDTAGPAYKNMADYLNAGGRVFNSHYHLNFFGNSPENGNGPDESLRSAAQWTLWSGTPSSAPFLIDTSFPKGAAMDEWLMNLKSASAWGASIKSSPQGQLATSNTGDIGGAVAGISQRWIYPQSGTGVVYVSINTPTTAPADQRCGRAVGTGIHVGNGQLTSMTEQEAALEFMFFDLASCVIDDAEPPTAPGPK